LNLCDSAVFCALHDQLVSLGRHTQLTRCFCAVAELLVRYWYKQHFMRAYYIAITHYMSLLREQ